MKKLTYKFCSEINYDGKERAFCDGEGLYLRVRKNTKSWILRISKNGRKKVLTIGRYPHISLADARKKVFTIKHENIKTEKYNPPLITTNIDNLEDQCFVYFLYENKKCIYVGQTKKDPKIRIKQHLKEKTFDSFSYLPVNRDKLDITEAAFILGAMPTMNKSVRLNIKN